MTMSENEEDEDIKNVDFESNTIRYKTWDEDVWGFNNCFLIFDKNGLLKSFQTVFYAAC